MRLFSSPTGVLYFKILESIDKRLDSIFSSPTGVLYFKIGMLSIGMVINNGFRPLLGFFISKLFIVAFIVVSLTAFVPYWGSLFQN